ncbi:MAG: ABC transporter substrate-binding protein, partial [Clostridia bacterium]
SSDLTKLLLQTVLSGDPFCDLATLWNGVQGTIMNQNILQPLDPYVDNVFLGEDDVDKKWVLVNKSFGSYYLMNRDLLFVNTWPLVYNIDYIEAVPALKENGKTVYPSDLYLRGEWTWNKFEDYLTKIKAYYNGKKGPVNPSNDILPYNTNYTYAALMAFHSNGAAVYDGVNMSFDSEEGKAAAEYMDKMITKGLISCTSASSTTTNSGWTSLGDKFNDGETVFTNCARWRMDDAGAALASRGQSMGVIPFPRPDSLSADSTQYQHLSAVADSVGLMKGISSERSERALEAYATYKSEFYKAMARVDSIAEYMDQQAASEALAFGVDIFHPEVGDANLQIFKELGSVPVNEFAESVGIQGTWGADILGASIYGVNGTPKYAIAVEANKNKIYDKIDNISKALKKGEVVDDVIPSASKVESGPIVFAHGTDPSKIDWTKIFSASDNVDGDYELRMEKGKLQLRKKIDEDAVDDDGNPIPQEEWEDGRISVDASGVDFNTTGKYTDGIVVTVTDEAGNKGEKKFEVFVYDENNTVPPTITLKEELPTLSIDTDTSTVDWAGKFVEIAQDVNGVDLKSNVSADVTSLDVTTAGKYPVTIYVTDFAGNKTGVATEIEVK